MIIDTSAILAILFREADAERIARAIAAASSRRISAATLLETTIVLESRSGSAAAHELDEFLRRAQIEPEPVTPEQAQTARRAWRRFGKGNHPGRTELRRLLCLRPGRSCARTASLQGRRFRTYQHSNCLNVHLPYRGSAPFYRRSTMGEITEIHDCYSEKTKGTPSPLAFAGAGLALSQRERRLVTRPLRKRGDAPPPAFAGAGFARRD